MMAKEIGLKSSRFHDDDIGSNAREVIEDVKVNDRSYLKLSDWNKRDHYHKSLKSLRKMALQYPDIERVDGRTLTAQQFRDKFEKQDQPCIITNTTEDWNVDKYWTFEQVYQRYKETKFKVGEDDKGHKIRIPLKYFLEYMVYNKDDSPLYLFESSIEDLKEGGKDILKRFKPHKYFLDDYFGLVGEKHRPPYRWFLMGPKRSGTTVHIDPLATSAWNTSLQGHKLWVLFPPHIPKCVVKAKGLEAKRIVHKDDLDEAIDYFLYALPKLIETEGANNLQLRMTVQGPGETIFVPGNWWHAVLNLDNTMAITQNFMSDTNFDKVWRSVRKERPKFSKRLLKAFKKHRKDLYIRTQEINQQDGMNRFEMSQSSPTQLIHPLSSDTSSDSSSSSSQSSSSSSSSSDTE